jgi:hypothetical protein
MILLIKNKPQRTPSLSKGRKANGNPLRPLRLKKIVARFI